MCGADCWTDHRLIITKMNLSIKPKRRPQGSKSTERLNVATLKTSLAAEKLSEELESQLKDIHPGNNIEDDWASFQKNWRASSRTFILEIILRMTGHLSRTQYTLLLSSSWDPPHGSSKTDSMRTMKI